MPIPFDTIRQETYFYFVRHGESQANTRGVIQGLGESPLSKNGIRQAEAVGAWFQKKSIDIVFSSPLGRAQQTANIIAQRCTCPCEVVENARELDTGIFSNKRWDEVQQEHAQVAKRFRVDSWEAVPDAERISSLQSRAAAYWQHVITTANTGARNMVTVSHGGFLQWVLKTSMGAASRWMPLVPAKNCAVFCLFVRPASYHTEHPSKDVVPDGYYAAWQYMNYEV